MTRRNCIFDTDDERYILVFDDESDGPAMQAIARWRRNPDLAFDQAAADAMLRTILWFSPLTVFDRES